MVAVHHPPPAQLLPARPARVIRHSAARTRPHIDRVVIKRDDGRGSATPIVTAIAEPGRS